MSHCIVLDPFLGSGSTLMACQQTDRICYGIELDEKFVDVIVKRYISECGSEGVFVLRGNEKIPMIKCKNDLLLSAFRVIYVLAKQGGT